MGAPVRYDRAVRVEVTDPEDPIGNLIEYGRGRGLRMGFDVLKTNDLQPNTGRIRIFNLNETTRGQLQGKIKRRLSVPATLEGGTAVPGDAQQTANRLQIAYTRLFAGYGDTPEQILEGTAERVESNRPGLDWLTDLSFGDSEATLRASIANKVFKPGTGVEQPLQYLIDTLGVATAPGFSVTLAQALAEGKLDTSGVRTDFPKGLSLFGPSRELLQQLLDLLDLRAQITDGEFTILRSDGSIDATPLLLTDTSGLLEAPVPLEEDTYSVVSYLEPRFQPGRTVRIETASLTGTFVVEQVRHRGDTHGDEFRSRAELRTLGIAL